MMPLIQYYVDYFNDENNNGFLLLKSSVCLNVLSYLHSKFIRDNEAVELKDLPQDKKEKYWELAKQYYSETDKRTQASKTCYVLELITSTY